jgi:hypothetical protein
MNITARVVRVTSNGALIFVFIIGFPLSISQ